MNTLFRKLESSEITISRDDEYVVGSFVYFRIRLYFIIFSKFKIIHMHMMIVIKHGYFKYVFDDLLNLLILIRE
jgi:hypothetical protein